MGLGDLRRKNESEKASEKQVEHEFTNEELDFLLQLIANSTFEGRDVQLVYQTALKIQNKIKG